MTLLFEPSMKLVLPKILLLKPCTVLFEPVSVFKFPTRLLLAPQTTLLLITGLDARAGLGATWTLDAGVV